MFWNVVAILLLVGLLAAIIKLFSDILRQVCAYVIPLFKRYAPISEVHRNILEKYSAYYNVLNSPQKIVFEKRVQRFMYSKTFIPRSVSKVTDEMRVLISASAVQLTFGLGRIFLAHFDKIMIYMDAYYSSITQKYHLGEVNPRAGIIVISWKSFVDGYANISDSLNLGIHEMAHAIHFENRIKNEEYGFLNDDALKQLEIITLREMKKINAGEEHFLRSYAGTNGYEFFAVALEYFFENPVDLRKAIPDLYATLTRLLQQDPINLYKLAT